MIPKNSVHGAFDSSVQVLLYFLTDLNLFVGNLPFTGDSAQLVELFEGGGSVEMVEVLHDCKTTGRSRGFGFVSHHLGSRNFEFGGLKDFSGAFESAELLVILCNDEFMRKSNKEWRDEDRATGVVSKSKHVPGLKIPNVVLGDFVISVQMAAGQAEQRGHTLLDEMRLLMLLWIILVASCAALVIQSLAANLGVVTGKHLAEHCRAKYPKKTNFILWVLAEISIVACDIPEVIGTAFALDMLFNIPIWIGILLTGLSTLMLLALQQYGVRKLEFLIAFLVLTIAGCFFTELGYAKPAATEVLEFSPFLL